MGIFTRKRRELRADGTDGAVGFEDALLKALLGGGEVTKETAMQVPTVSGGIDLIGSIVAGTPIKLYKEADGKTSEVRDDPRVRLLNDETGDTLDANQFWRAITRDYYLGKGGYAYICRRRGQVKSIHYVDEAHVSIVRNNDPIFKDYDIMVNGHSYLPFDFLKILRNTQDGAQGVPITKENSHLIEVAMESLLFERNLVRRGGNKKGFLKSEKRISEEAMASLRAAFSRLYSNESTENAIVLNSGVDFRESSNSSVEMQLNDNKQSNAEEFAKIFHISPDVMCGRAGENDVASLARLAAIPLMTVIQCALNRDLLLESEKGTYYWAFDTKELLKGDMQSRFAAYKTALDANFMQIDEVRFAEDMEPLGLTWVKLGLNDVLYDPETKQVYTPNTNKTTVMGENGVPEEPEGSAGQPEPVTATDVKEAAETVANKTLNGAQTQSLITVVQQYQTGTLTLQQAVNIISVSIGVSKEAAQELIGESTEPLQKVTKVDILGNIEKTESEMRANPNHDPKNGRFASASDGTGNGDIKEVPDVPKGKKQKYAASPQANESKVKIGKRRYGKVRGIVNTKYPGLKAGEQRIVWDNKYKYAVVADGAGGISVQRIWKL